MRAERLSVICKTQIGHGLKYVMTIEQYILILMGPTNTRIHRNTPHHTAILRNTPQYTAIHVHVYLIIVSPYEIRTGDTMV